MSVVVAATLDSLVGEPPEVAHPVVWTGRYLERASLVVPPGPVGRATVSGAAAWLAGATVAVAAALAVDRVAARAPRPVRVVARGLALWPLGSGRLLLAEVEAVERALQHDLGAGRATLARIVGRDTTGLPEDGVRSAAIESLAENLSDSVVAPLFWYAVAGLPGAALHRFANTADACWGHRTRRWNHAGRVAARADDVLNLVPARLTALLLATPGSRVRREARRTSSPNAGWPMAVMAVRLDVRLAKPGHHVLNPGGASPSSRHVEEAAAAARRAALLAVLLATLADRLIPTPGGSR